MAHGANPTVRRRQLGSLLRGYRTRAELNVQVVAERLLCSPSKISRIETGQRAATLRDVRDLASLYGISEQVEIDHLMTLAREGRQRGWWQRLDLSPELSTYVALEAAASEIFEYQAAFVPGLLQTPSYASAVIANLSPDRTADEVRHVAEARSTRQERFNDPAGFVFWAVLDEAAIRHRVGGKDVLREQLASLISLAKARQITVQVIPFEVTSHPALDSSFVLLEFEESLSNVVYLENLAGQFFLESPGEIQRYRRARDRIRAVALGPEDSVHLIEQVMESLKD